MEGDGLLDFSKWLTVHFNPLPPHGGRLGIRDRMLDMVHFNPLPPHGGRLSSSPGTSAGKVFQSTPSAWRETQCLLDQCRDSRGFQSTPSAWRETVLNALTAGFCVFQSTPSAWRETVKCHILSSVIYISIHSLRMEGDEADCHNTAFCFHFNPLPPHGGRLLQAVARQLYLHFNPLPPHGGRRIFCQSML